MQTPVPLPFVHGTTRTPHAHHRHRALCLQVVIVPIVKKDTDRAAVDAAVDKLTAALKQAGLRVKVRAAPELSGHCCLHMLTAVQSELCWATIFTAIVAASCNTVLTVLCQAAFTDQAAEWDQQPQDLLSRFLVESCLQWYSQYCVAE